MKNLSKFMFFALLILGMGACDNDEKKVPLRDPIQISLTKAEQDLASSEQNNAIKVFSNLSKEEKRQENIMLSPYSLNVTLSMLLNGAQGDTKTEIQKVLGYGDNSYDIINGYHKKIADALKKTDPSTKLLISNSIWYRHSAKLKPSFQQLNENNYNAVIEGVDFSEGTTRSLINKWASLSTNGLIKEVIKEVNPQDMIYLLNALYFKGIWAEHSTFKKSETKEDSFTLEDKTKVKVPMMYQENSMKYLENEMFSAISLPYGNKAFSMVVLLPKENETVNTMLERISESDNFSQQMKSFSSAEVALYLPKFKFRYEKELKKTLKAMGMEKSFSKEADFTNAFEQAEIFLSFVNQYNYIDVNEKGTEAASVSVASGLYTSPGPRHNIVFKVDRPFVFLIRENSTGTLLFMGKVGNPLE